MFGLSSIPSSATPCRSSSAKTSRSVSDVTSRQRSIVLSRVHQHLGLDDRDDPGLLRERRVPRERVRVDVKACIRRDPVADRDHRAPLAEARAERVVLGEAPAEPVEALGDLLPGVPGEVLRARVDLDPGDDALAREELGERRAVVGRLADRLVVEDHAADVLLEARRREEEVPVRAAVLLGRLDADRVEPLRDRARGLVRGEDALVVGHDRARRSSFSSWEAISVLLLSATA